MNDLICLRELSESIVYHSNLNTSKSSRYCVLAANHFIIFKKSSDVISLYRIPINKDTIFDFMELTFSIRYYDFNFSFSHGDSGIILEWNKFLSEASKVNLREDITNFYAVVVRIDKIKTSECPIVISKIGWKLFIYKSYDYQRSDICCHVINLQYYNIASPDLKETILRSSAKVLIIKGFLVEFKLTFETPKEALEWNDILRCCKNNYLKSLSEKSVLSGIVKNKSNTICADCGVCDPKWVSINFCVTICDNCVGIHRQFGTMISRTQSVLIDDKCWNDMLLVQLLNSIGNENANNFWCKNFQNNNPEFTKDNIERKYKNKEFIDETYSNLSSDEILEKLSDSVKSSDVVLTMKLWFSNRTSFDREILNMLLKSARDSDQILQEKFLSLQENVAQSLPKDDFNLKPVFEGIFNLSYNNGDKITNLIMVSLFPNRITISADSPDIVIKEMVEICTIYLNFLNMVRFFASKNILQLAFYPECKFNLTTPDKRHNIGYVNITQLSIFDMSRGSLLSKLKMMLLDFLLPIFFEPPTLETSLFFYADIKINKEPISQCKCHVTNHELIIGCPIETKYDLTLAHRVFLDVNQTSVLIALPFCDLLVSSFGNGQIILESVKEASKIRFLSLNNDRTLVRLEELINFIKIFGLNFEGIFQKNGDPDKVDRLVDQLLEPESSFSLNSKTYAVFEVTSCLKKCMLSLYEPLIPKDVLSKLKESLLKDDSDTLFKEALKTLPKNNYRFLRHVVELLFLIVKRGKVNKMDSESLSELTVASLVSANGDGDDIDKRILRYFIDNFENLFDYSAKEKEAVLNFMNKLDNPSKISINRSFYIELSLKYLFNESKFRSVEYTKLDVLLDNSACMLVSVRIDVYTTIMDLIAAVFNETACQQINLWVYIYLENKVYKRLLYGNERIDEAIVNRRQFPIVYVGEKSMERLLFAAGDISNSKATIGTMYRCGVKVDRRRSEIIITMPNSLRIFDLESRNEVPKYELSLSNIDLYRTQGSATWKVFILTRNDEVVSCKFRERIEFQEFLLHFDMFYLRNMTFNVQK